MLATLLVLHFVGAFCAVTVSNDYNATIIFFQSSTNDSYRLTQSEKLFGNSNFVRSRPTMIYVHGYNPDKDLFKTIVNAYSQSDNFNILILDWRELATTFYLFAASKIDELGLEVAKFLQKMSTQGYDINNWHLVGHSLGAHLAGYVGRHIQYFSNKLLKISRITGLDPAFPGFYALLIGPQPINKMDASFVDIIHTDAGIAGTPFNTGSVDFWPNDGRRPQPGCSLFNDILGSCSHSRSIELWAESINNKGKDAFISQNENDSKIQVQMGLECPTNSTPGRYNLLTNSRPPYSRS